MEFHTTKHFDISIKVQLTVIHRYRNKHTLDFTRRLSQPFQNPLRRITYHEYEPSNRGQNPPKFLNCCVAAVSAMFAADQIVRIGSRKQMAEGARGKVQLYNASVQPQQDRLYEALSMSFVIYAQRSRPTDFPMTEIQFSIGRNYWTLRKRRSLGI
jgi:hypothetical protein